MAETTTPKTPSGPPTHNPSPKRSSALSWILGLLAVGLAVGAFLFAASWTALASGRFPALTAALNRFAHGPVFPPTPPAVLGPRRNGSTASSATASRKKEPHNDNAEHPPRRVVEYNLSVRLDAEKKRITGRMVLYWRNTSPRPAHFLPFHLYMNAFKNEESLFMRESHGTHRGYRLEAGEWGFIEVSRVRVDGRDRTSYSRAQGCMKRPCTHSASKDQTVLRVDLAKPILPGQRARIDMDFTTQLPRVFARTGYAGSFFMVGQWFPKIGVLETAGWKCHPFHLTSEFYADFGVYTVELDLPADHRVGATGELVTVEPADAKRKKHTFVARDVHDFAFACGPQLRTRSLNHGATALTVMAPENLLGAAFGHLALNDRALSVLERILGPYPYSTLTVVVPPLDAPGAAGMEYPNLFVTQVSRFGLAGVLEDEQTTVHELIHQYFHGLLASNEHAAPWLDEGFTTYMTGVVMDELYGADTSFLRIAGLELGYFPLMRLCHKYRPDWDPIAQPAPAFASFQTYGVHVYCKAALLLKSLEQLLGKKRMFALLRSYVQRFRFRHPTTQDFLELLATRASPRVTNLFRRALRTAETVDHRVVSIQTRRLHAPRGIFGTGDRRRVVDASKEKQSDTRYESDILLHRRGNLAWPVEVRVSLADGKTQRHHWDDDRRWKKIRVQHTAPVVAAQLDPERKVWLDLNRLNDGLRVEADPTGARRVATRYGLLLQWMLQGAGF